MIKQIIFCIGLCGVVPLNAWAVAPGDINAIAPQQNQILQQQQQIQNNEQRELRRFAPPEPLVGKGLGETKGEMDGKCIDIQAIQFHGAALQKPQKLQQLINKPLPQCLTLAQINDIIRGLTQLYMEKGYVTSRAYLTPQSIDKGTLTIEVLEGKVENVVLREPAARNRIIDTLFPGMAGKVLNIRDIEQGLDQVKRLPSYDASIKMEPGKETGATDVAVELAHSNPFSVSLTYDNSGVSTTGKDNVQLAVGADDLLGLFEQWYISSKHDAETNAPGVLNRSLSGNLSIPYGYWGLRLNSSYFEYESQLRGLSQNFSSTGKTYAHTVEIERYIHRDQLSKTKVSTSLTAKDTRNYIEGEKINTSSRILSVGGLTLAHSRTIDNGVANLSVTFEHGLELFGALEDDETPGANHPRAQFKKWSGDISYQKPIPVKDLQFVWNTQLHGQWSPDTLYSTERISLGGLYTVRGFRDQTVGGDIGGYIRNDLQLVLAQPIVPLQKIISQIVPYVGFDAGWIKTDSLDSTEKGMVQGLAAGVKMSGKYSDMQIGWERSLERPAFVRDEGNLLYIKLGVRW